jgi:hypothetical protein
MDKYLGSFGINGRHLYAILHEFDSYTIELCELNDDENELNANRFSNFSLELLPGMVEIVVETPKGKFQNWISSLFHWISDNIKHKWFLEVVDVPKARLQFLWYFEDKNDAMFFKLSH